MPGFGGMDENRGGAGSRQGRRDLARHMARLAHAGDDDPPLGAFEKRNRGGETVVETGFELDEGVYFGLEDLPSAVQYDSTGRFGPDVVCYHARLPGPS